MSVSGNARAPTKLYIAASDAGTRLIRVRASGEAFLDLAGVESIELTIPDGALAATSVRCEASVWPQGRPRPAPRTKVQHEWVRVRAKLDADEGHLLDHETGHEGNVAAQPIELGDDDRRLPVAAGLGQGGAQLRAAIGTAASVTPAPTTPRRLKCTCRLTGCAGPRGGGWLTTKRLGRGSRGNGGRFYLYALQ